MSNTLFLSYPLNNEAFGYGNGDRFEISQVRDMCCGDTSNNSEFKMPTHYGTHIDFPFHFSETGKKSTDYEAKDFIYNQVGVVEVDATKVEDYLIRSIDLELGSLNSNTELLFIKTGFCNKRYTNEYWEFGFGFHPETATFLKQKFSNLKVIAFDLISMNSYQQREVGREAHKQFLIENDILIVEEVDLTQVTDETKFKEVIIAPLMLDKADGAPVTIIAKTA